MARKRKQDSSGKQGVLPVMRADAAGIDIERPRSSWRFRPIAPLMRSASQPGLLVNWILREQ